MTPRAFRAPGRVNLIGDHTDYNEGFVLPLAIQLECVVTVLDSGGDVVRLRSRELEGGVEVAADGTTEPSAVVPSWGRYVAGLVRTLADRGRPAVGLEGDVASSVPVGGGLSSSAALEVAVALALCDAASFSLEPDVLAAACRDAEQASTGVPCGIMDQLTSVGGRAGHALFVDCRSLDVEPVPLSDELAIVVVDSGLSRSLHATPYAERRAACEAAAARLGLSALRDATPSQVADDPRARHVVSENGRVLAAVEALRRSDAPALGSLLTASHASLRDDFEVSTPELDELTGALEQAGAYGARLTGAGFGGCVVAVARREHAAKIAEEAVAHYSAATGLSARVTICRAVDGAGTLEAAVG